MHESVNLFDISNDRCQKFVASEIFFKLNLYRADTLLITTQTQENTAVKLCF